MSEAAAQRVPQTSRLAALDVARGLMLVVSVAVNAWFTAPAWFEHAVWVGVHPIDLVFPVFVTLSGAGLAMTYARGVRLRREVRRVVTLYVVGVAFTALLAYLATGRVEWATFDLTGVLQLYAGIVAGMVTLRLTCRSWRGWLVAGLTLAAAQALLLAIWAHGCPGGVLTPECNPSRVIDVAVFGAPHVYVEGTRGHDPSGLVVLVGALATAACGAAGGRALLDHARGGSTREMLRRAVVTVVVSAVGAVVAAQWVPAFKRLWTAPFALAVAAGVVAVLTVLHVLLDGRQVSRAEACLRYPLVALGRNSLLVYFGSHAVVSTLLRTGPSGEVPVRGRSWAEVAQHGAAEWVGAPGAAWPWCITAVVAWTLLAMLLHRRHLYIKA
ncbi:heparan-alpha-glucosaminide N-acetyltransferase domain-containing protein [Mobilicoccus sp.]|uniref:heparan-alpha-glucosaminide N-acetyltransferase domain-containing protein n=1 Tax=Mobilicoccus sp. TaxID=2034349 RepID=UPI0028AE1F02|nr:heparan-alpha-glucosaminide N-acetyltransferase domain-containing protein [Mobilicoccus sp.]